MKDFPTLPTSSAIARKVSSKFPIFVMDNEQVLA